MTVGEISWVVVTVLSAVGAVFTLILAVRRTRFDSDKQEPSLDDRILQLHDHLAESASLIAQIQAEFRLQEAALEKIKAEAERNQRLAELHQKESRCCASRHRRGPEPRHHARSALAMAVLLRRSADLSSVGGRGQLLVRPAEVTKRDRRHGLRTSAEMMSWQR
jgi:hypothetical protein